MKSTMIVLLVFFLASDLHAQARRRSGWPPATVNDGPNSLDPTDPFAAIRSHVESSSATPAPPRPAANPVPVSQLRIPSKALKEFERSQKAFHSGDVPTSVEHLQKAVQIFPDRSASVFGYRLSGRGRALCVGPRSGWAGPRHSRSHGNASFE